jgi:single-strand DNA-binding protein
MINQATLIGRVGKMDTKTTSTGIKICNMSMVTSKKFMKDGQKTEKVTWHNITFFSKIAEVVEKYVLVGDLLYVQGEMDNQKYMSKDGQEKTRSFIIAHDLQMFPKSKELKPEPKKEENKNQFVDDDIPW